MLAYTRRFDEVIQALPLRVWATHLFPDEELLASSDELKLCVLRCLNLIAQMHYFSRAGYIPKNVWRRSEGGFAQLLRSPLFVREWKSLAPIFATDGAFCRYVEKVQHESTGVRL